QPDEGERGAEEQTNWPGEEQQERDGKSEGDHTVQGRAEIAAPGGGLRVDRLRLREVTDGSRDVEPAGAPRRSEDDDERRDDAEAERRDHAPRGDRQAELDAEVVACGC